MAPRATFLKPIQRLMASLERIQVELHGRYSTDRLHQFMEYSQSTTSLRALAVLVLTAIPCALCIVLVDVLPLQPPYSPLAEQTASYWVRAFYSCCVVTGTTFLQWRHASADLSLTLFCISVATLINATGTTLTMLALHLLVGFPTPFLYQVIAVPWLLMQAIAMWLLTKHTIRANATVKQDLLCFLYLWAAEVTMIIVYPVLNYVFRSINGQYQTLFSVVLPLWKLALKNWCRLGTSRLEDLAPVLVVFNVDVFHALFLASAMQSSSTTGSNTLVVVMSIDFIQSCVAIMEVYLVRERVKQLEQLIRSTNIKQIRDEEVAQTALAVRCLRRSTVEHADRILESSPQVREHLAVCNSRKCHWTPVLRPITVHPRKMPPASVPRVRFGFDRAITSPDQSNIHSNDPPNTHQRRLGQTGQAKLAYVQANLKMLHMVEFYMLIEFTEVLIAVVYSIYLLAMAHLPNRQYYLPLQALTEDQFADTVRHVMKYAALELLSFVLLAMVFDRMLRISTLRQLAFTLEKHWLLVQSLLVLWVFFPTQMTLEHLGCDYTFKFAWLLKPATSQ